METREYIEKLTFKFDNKKPIELTSFLESISSFQKEYKHDIENAGLRYNDEDIKLYIQVREGCIEWEFVRKWIANTLIPTSAYDLLKKTAVKVVSIFNKTKNDENLDDIPSNEIINARKIFSPASNDFSSKYNINYSNCEDIKVINIFATDGITTKAVCDKMEEILEIKKTPTDDTFKEEILYWKHIANDDKNIKTIDKGIIETFSDKPVKLLCSTELKQKMIKETAQNPTNIYYIVNGSIKKANNKIIAYQITEIIGMEEIED